MPHIQCKVCTRSFNDAGALENHAKATHHHYCAACDKVCTTTAGYEQHMSSSRHMEECKFCNGRFRIGTGNLKQHIRKEHPSCKPCDRIFVSKDALQHHLDTSGKHVQQCEICEKRLSIGTEDLKQHMRKEHPSCKQCDRIFVGKEALQHHLDTSGKHVQRCEICEKRFSIGTENLKQHMRKEHPSCKQCDRIFVSKEALQHHLNTSGKHVQQCDFCEERFTIGTKARERHIREEHPSCQPCGRAFTSKEALQYHLDTSGEHIQQCDFCEQRFNIGTKGLERHMRIEHPSCKQCDRIFVSKERLERQRRRIILLASRVIVHSSAKKCCDGIWSLHYT